MWVAERRLVRQALNTPFKEWESIVALIEQTNDPHTKEVLRRLMYVKKRRVEDGN